MDFYGRYASAVNGGFNYRTARPLALAANAHFPPLVLSDMSGPKLP